MIEDKNYKSVRASLGNVWKIASNYPKLLAYILQLILKDTSAEAAEKARREWIDKGS